MTYTIAECTVNPDDGQRNCPKNVEFHLQNKFEKSVHIVGLIIKKILRKYVLSFINHDRKKKCREGYDLYLRKSSNTCSKNFIIGKVVPIHAIKKACRRSSRTAPNIEPRCYKGE
jgi:hypothetical protein